jgi:hypothetical protein
MALATMPKTSVYEYCNPFSWEDEVGIASQHEVPPPAGNSVSAKSPAKLELRRFVPVGTYGSHDFRALLLGEHIGHSYHPG